MHSEITFTLDGERVSVDCNPLRRLLDVLREDFNLVGVKEGCGEGECGACAVIVDGKLVNSCIVPVGAVNGAEILTIEGIKKTEIFGKIADAFAQMGAVQCGFCTPGMIVATYAILNQNPKPSRKEIVEGLSGNLCRCTGMNIIIEAVEMAAKNIAR
ncbi:(2Fe-2S)-binding protein [bacterium]|nr:(2Fe-2S)-binding protein [bacterium]